MSFAPAKPFKPYAEAHDNPQGAGDARPTAFQIIKDEDAVGKYKGKTVLITGASSGIGVETARALYETGAQLYLTARDMPKLEKVIEDIVQNATIGDAPRPKPLEIHLDSLDSTRKGAEDFKKQSGQLNILINNAGVMACPQGKTKDDFELQIGTNHFAHFLLFQLLKPLLLSSSTPDLHSRVVNLSSAGHRFGTIRFQDINFSEPDSYNKWTSYGQSKTANIYMASSIERHYGSQGLHGWSVHPGGITTELGRHMTQDDFEEIGWPKFTNIMKTPPQGAATTVWAAVSDHFEGKNGGRYLEDCSESSPLPSEWDTMTPGYAPHIYNEADEEKFWKLSCEMLGLPAES
ncbi:hypothetical protein CERZMDRAFT_109842 [Cercospora zeae-maydis SCOH1-5]|uniref:Uncharacterized protein n=1 Tax=Cercospora zeae-maydis SCOH1-5 TaxID=717836 RepID=A0A6A6FRX9_9PEZI|nr:hypothetical protein CERZMDRAFT_109842 [Cercospora zeae-maydis SCOH1-5]